MKQDFKYYKLKKEEFELLSVLEKRTYLLQDDEYHTMWWSRTANMVIVILGFIGVVIGLILSTR